MKPQAVTLRQLEYFVAAVEFGTFSAAAQHFHISQTSISLGINELERALSVQVLLRRRARGPSLTAAGRALLADARQVLAHVGEIQDTARGLGEDVSGRLAVGSFPTITPHVMGRVLEGVAQRHPDLVVDLVEDQVDGLQNRLADGRCEVAIMYEIGLGADVVTTPLYRCRPYAVLAPDHPLADRSSIQVDEVIAEPMVLIDLLPSAEFFIDRLTAAGYDADIRYRSASVETIRTMVGRGLGWGILLHKPDTPTTYDGGQVREVDLEDLGEPVDVLLVRSASARSTRRLEAFMAVCRDVLREPAHGAIAAT